VSRVNHHLKGFESPLKIVITYSILFYYFLKVFILILKNSYDSVNKMLLHKYLHPLEMFIPHASVNEHV